MPPGDAIATAALKVEGRLAEETSHRQVALWQYGGGIGGEARPIERLLGLCTASAVTRAVLHASHLDLCNKSCLQTK